MDLSLLEMGCCPRLSVDLTFLPARAEKEPALSSIRTPKRDTDLQYFQRIRIPITFSKTTNPLRKTTKRFLSLSLSLPLSLSSCCCHLEASSPPHQPLLPPSSFYATRPLRPVQLPSSSSYSHHQASAFTTRFTSTTRLATTSLALHTHASDSTWPVQETTIFS